jgi:transcription initiation factor IIE alpha subunit
MSAPNNNESKVNSKHNEDISQIYTTVPTHLKRLIRIILRNFYGFELFLCMEMLMLYPCIKEEDLAEVLRLDLKVVHQHLLNLKREKFINEKSIMETSSIDGKQSKHSYFYINYKMMVNVIKYKLDKIRIQIESEENQFTTRANFKCTLCKKSYSDLDTKDIFLTMQCLYCGADVDEDTSSMPTKSARNLLNKFNTQMKEIFELLSKVEHIRLENFILRPEPVDMTEILNRISNASGTTNPKTNAIPVNGKSAMVKFDKWSGDKTRNVDIFGQTTISINFDSADGPSNLNRKNKELPSILLLNRTQEDDLDNANNRDSILLNNVMKAADEISLATANNLNSNDKALIETPQHLTPSVNTASNNKINTSSVSNSTTTNSLNGNNILNNLESIIMQKLLKHEKKIDSTSINNDSNININDFNDETKASHQTSKSSSSLTITKKRNLDENTDSSIQQISKFNVHSNSNIEKNDMLNQKKRKLNSGGLCVFVIKCETSLSNINHIKRFPCLILLCVFTQCFGFSF